MDMITKANNLALNKDKDIKVFEFLKQGNDLLCYVVMNIYDVIGDSLMQELIGLKYYNLFFDENNELNIEEILKQEEIPVYFLNCVRCSCGKIKHFSSFYCEICGEFLDYSNNDIELLIKACKNIVKNKKEKALMFQEGE